jgi:hypothetical protein
LAKQPPPSSPTSRTDRGRGRAAARASVRRPGGVLLGSTAAGGRGKRRRRARAFHTRAHLRLERREAADRRWTEGGGGANGGGANWGGGGARGVLCEFVVRRGAVGKARGLFIGGARRFGGEIFPARGGSPAGSGFFSKPGRSVRRRRRDGSHCCRSIRAGRRWTGPDGGGATSWSSCAVAAAGGRDGSV